MKKFKRTFLLVMLLTILLAGSVSAVEEEYVLIKEYSYKNTEKNELNSAFVEILIGSGDFVQYQDDEYITLSPNPDEIKEDKFGNKYAYYNLAGMKPGTKFNVTVKRKVRVKNYVEMVPSRTNTDLSEVSNIYLLPQERIDSKDDEIISKAKELTEDIASDYNKAKAIFEYINVNMQYNTAMEYSNKGSISALKNMKGVCEEFATLYVAMCRAVNIPSRAVVGYWVQYEEKENESGDKIKERQLIDHVWPEIYLQDFGWVPVEPTYISLLGSNRIANLNAFVKMEIPDHIATGLYYYEKADRAHTPVLEEIIFERNLKEISSGEFDLKENKFEDIKEYEWAKSAIQFLYEIDVVNGYSDVEYGPQRNISRIEFISMLSRALKYKETPSSENALPYYYLDYDQEHWSKNDYDFLMRCYQELNPKDVVGAGYYDIAEVFDEGKIEMDKPITRAEVVALMDAFLKDDDTLPKLTDIWGHKFEKSIVKAYNAGLIVGYPDMTYKPNGKITRAEMAVILERYIGNELYNII